MASVLTKLKPLIIQPVGKHTSTVIFLHGSGDTGKGIREWIDNEIQSGFNFKQTRLIFPTAPLRPYIAAMGQLSNVWFQRRQISPFVEEEMETINESTADISQLVDMEVKNGISPERIVVGGFSMGGSLALYYGMRCELNLAGIFALSSLVGNQSCVYDDLEENPGPRPPLFQAHGQKDDLVLYDWGVQTNTRFKQLGVQSTFHTFPNLFHQLSNDELTLLKSWIEERLPLL